MSAQQPASVAAPAASSSSSQQHGERQLVVDPFCYRQFREHEEASRNYLGTVFHDVSVDEFERIVNEQYVGDESKLQPGYADFCKHLFIENDFTDAKTNVLPITADNEHLLRTRYEARNERELPVLTRYFPKELVAENGLPKAKWLDLILYSREQIEKENAAQQGGGGKSFPEYHSKAPWGIVSIKAQDVDRELPMTPITAMRNALGKEEGGSGVKLDRNTYLEAVEYWKDHANVS